MSLIALILAAELAAAPPATLILDKVRPVEDPRIYVLTDSVQGDRGVPRSCGLSGTTSVTLVSRDGATLEVVRDGTKKSIVIENVKGLGRATLACGDGDAFYYANPRTGRVYAYSANRLFRGDDPVVWTRSVAPFTSIDDANGVMTNASVATVVQSRRNMVLVEWFFRTRGVTGFWHEVFDAATGATLGKLGPSDLLVKTNENDPWWILFEGGGNETVNYVPRNLYRLTYGPPIDGAKPAAETLVAIRAQSEPQRAHAIATLSENPVINHMIALLTPTRSSPTAKLDFCPQVPAQRARYWLGNDYDELLATLARDILMAFVVELQRGDSKTTSIDAWFQAEIAPKEPMKTLVAHFNSQDDQWIASYQQALLGLGRPTFERLFAKYGRATGAVTSAPAGRGGR